MMLRHSCLEVRVLPKDERQKLLKKAGVKSSIDVTRPLVIKAEIYLLLYHLRILHMWKNTTHT